MKPFKQYKKLQRLNIKAESCLSRKEAQEVLKKANKAQKKLALANWYGR